MMMVDLEDSMLFILIDLRQTSGRRMMSTMHIDGRDNHFESNFLLLMIVCVLPADQLLLAVLRLIDIVHLLK
jgi:hypothetical protein